jgi:SAM-dependent methyltransferase
LLGEAVGDREDRMAWAGVVEDPMRLVDRTIEALQPLEGTAVLEIGAYAPVFAARYAQKARHVWAATFEPGALKPTPASVSVLPLTAIGLPLPNGQLDLAIARAALDGSWPLDLNMLIEELERVVGGGGLAVCVHVDYRDGEIGLLAANGIPASRLSDQEAEWENIFAENRFVPASVASIWQAPGRSILRRVVQAEMGGEPTWIAERIATAELTCHYRVYSRRFGS